LRLPVWLTADKALSIFGGGSKKKTSGRAEPSWPSNLDLDLHVTVREMSRGMCQKLGHPRLAHAPRLLILDEPTNSLDPLRAQLSMQFRAPNSARKGNRYLSPSPPLAGTVEHMCERSRYCPRRLQLVADESLAKVAELRHPLLSHGRPNPGLGITPPPFSS